MLCAALAAKRGTRTLALTRELVSREPALRSKLEDAFFQGYMRWNVRADFLEIISTLHALRSRRGVPWLTLVAGDSRNEVYERARAVQTLGDLGDERAVPVLVRLGRRSEPYYRRVGCKGSLRGDLKKDALEALRKLRSL